MPQSVARDSQSAWVMQSRSPGHLGVEQLRQQPAGMSLTQYSYDLRAAIIDCQDNQDRVTDTAEMAGRRDNLFASEQRELDRWQEKRDELAAIYARVANSPEGRSVDRSQITEAGTQPEPWQVHEQRARGEAIDQRATAPRPDDDRGAGRWHHSGRGHVYSEQDTTRSWVRDLVEASLHGSHDARERLVQNNRAVSQEVRALSTGDGSGGEWVPPLWLVQQSLALARAGRVVADQVTRLPLPEGTDSINLPRMVTGTAVAEQTVQNTNVQETDATTDSITANVATLAGSQTVPLQLIEQSPIGVDQVILPDLLADLATKIDRFVLLNNATNKVGILNVVGVNAVSYTDGTPTMSELYPKIADAVQQIHTGRFLPASKVFMHPRRWAWMTAQSDSTGRPLVVPAAQMPSNAAAAMDAVAAEGFVGSLQGLPAFVDPNIPTTLGSGNNEDRLIVARAEDVVLMEGIPRAEAFREPLARQLSVLLRVYNYVALHAGRYPKSISIIGGTGLAAPTF